MERHWVDWEHSGQIYQEQVVMDQHESLLWDNCLAGWGKSSRRICWFWTMIHTILAAKVLWYNAIGVLQVQWIARRSKKLHQKDQHFQMQLVAICSVAQELIWVTVLLKIMSDITLGNLFMCCRAAFQKDLIRLEKCAGKTLTVLSDDKRKF